MNENNTIIGILNSFGYNIDMNEINELTKKYEKKNSKCILFSRVSTDRQDLTQQNNELFDEAKRCGFNEDDIILIEQKESAIKLDEAERIGIQELKKAIETQDIEVVIIYEISRLSRRPEVLYSIRNYLIEHNVNLICMKPYMRLLDPDGNMSQTANILFSVFSSLSESEMMIKKERFARGRKNKMMQGKYIGGSILFGYKVEKDTDKIIVDKEDAKTVIEIYERYIKHESIRSIAIDLMDRGMLRYSSYECARGMVRRILTASEYAGIKTTSYDYPQIVPIKLYEQAQSKKGTKCRSTNNIYYCKGLIHWKKNDHILSPMLGQLSYGTHYGFSKDELMLVNMNLMDSLILHTVINHRNKMKGTIKKKTINEILDRMNANNQKMQKITSDIEEIKDIIDRINERIVKGRILEEKGDKMIDDEQKRYSLLIKTMRTISDENKELDKQLEKIMHGNELEYDKIDDTQKYNIIHDDIERIEIDKDNIEKGGKYIEVMFKDTTIYKYHLTKYGNYDRIYIIDNDKETRLEGFNVIRRFGRN